VLALVGGYDFHAGGFDRAQRAGRQPGSSFKPFVYAAAIESGRYTAASLVNDAPEVYELWKPQNYEKEEFRGPVRLRVALAHSINTVAIKVLDQVGIPAVKDMASRVGITSPIPDDVGKALALVFLILQLSAAGGVLPIELTGAVFRDLSPWLPFTWVVRAFRASLFGAYDNTWLTAWGAILMAAAVAFVISTVVGRWRFVSEAEHRPALDL